MALGALYTTNERKNLSRLGQLVAQIHLKKEKASYLLRNIHASAPFQLLFFSWGHRSET